MHLGVRNSVKSIDKKIWHYANNWADYRRNYICVRLYFTLFIAMCLQALVLYREGVEISALFSLTLAFLYLSAIYFFYIGKVTVTKNVSFIVSNLLLFVGSSFYGRESYNYLSFIPLLVAVVFIYGHHEMKSMVFMMMVTVLNFVVLELTDYALLSHWSDGRIDSEYNKWMVIFISVVFGFYMLYELIKINKHTEEKLKRWNRNLYLRNEKLKRSNEDLDSFVYRVSHDLRAPLTSIMGVINVVKTESDASKVKGYMKYQEQSVKKLDDLIQDVLDISRNAKLNVVIEPILLKKFIQDCVDSFSYMEDFSKIRITVDIPEELVLYSDSRRLKFIFNNLISNSIRYYDLTKEQSSLMICTENQVSETISILFDDNGIGIHEDHLERVFDMFYRGTYEKTGSGLGLFIVKDSIEKLNGSISLHSVYGKGTRVLMGIPNARNYFHKKTTIDFHVI